MFAAIFCHCGLFFSSLAAPFLSDTTYYWLAALSLGTRTPFETGAAYYCIG